MQYEQCLQELAGLEKEAVRVKEVLGERARMQERIDKLETDVSAALQERDIYKSLAG